jgi:hypothetical protein
VADDSASIKVDLVLAGRASRRPCNGCIALALLLSLLQEETHTSVADENQSRDLPGR